MSFSTALRGALFRHKPFTLFAADKSGTGKEIGSYLRVKRCAKTHTHAVADALYPSSRLIMDV